MAACLPRRAAAVPPDRGAVAADSSEVPSAVLPPSTQRPMPICRVPVPVLFAALALQPRGLRRARRRRP
eukprot:15440141-Alexandrium_andersonii.AAC.1